MVNRSKVETQDCFVKHFTILQSSSDSTPVANRTEVKNGDIESKEISSPKKTEEAETSKSEQIEVARVRIQSALEELERLLNEQVQDTIGTISATRQTMRRLSILAPAELGRVSSQNGAKAPPPPATGTPPRPIRKRPYSIRRQYSGRGPGVLGPIPGGDGGEYVRSSLNEVDYCSRYVFPIAFVLFVVVYWTALIYYKLA